VARPRRVRTRIGPTVMIATVLAFGATGCTTPREAARDEDSTTIVVGVSGAFAESQIVAEMYAMVLEDAGYDVERQLDLRSREVSQYALESGQIDLKPEYLSSLLLFVDPNAAPSNESDDVASKVRDVLEPRGIEVLTPSPAQDTNQFVANAETAQRFGLTTMSSLADVADRLTLGAPPECPQRPFCLAGMAEVYGIVFHDFKPLDIGGPQTVAALDANEVQIGLLFSTDPSIEANGFVPLIDDKHLQNAENVTPVIRSDRLTPEVREALDAVSASLSSQSLTTLVGKVAIHGQDTADVAREFLMANGVL
jgi:osmoprotectant transport system substrate-binding protein